MPKSPLEVNFGRCLAAGKSFRGGGVLPHKRLKGMYRYGVAFSQLE